jgi:Protein of unknown function (DUF2946)
MRQPGGHRSFATGRMAVPHRSTRLLMLLALLIYQPLGALHSAIDEQHLSGPTRSSQTTRHAGKLHDHAGHGHDSEPDHAHHEICDFCMLVGSAMPPPSGAAAPVPATWERPASHFAVAAIRPPKPVRVGHPVRAPPRSV